MTDHHDFGFDHHDFDGHDPMPFDDHTPPDDHLAWEDGHDYDLGHDAEHEAVPHDTVPHDAVHDADDAPPPEAAHTEAPELADPPEEPPFPPAVDVGDLPEPVDGFPWIDTGSLGVADLHPELDTTDPVHPAELAEYNATDLPPGADPWAALADSDDPATAALAKWWQQN
ncbi:hypothetical protein ODJ79_02095 [Actinoplanes sp. KI2]|uniref:hypothetical protein n=1 Tax=Actinoplanes sp. KI2 TaxID=2983315 RepID=UPI0021D61103|nr:hypothetical protein [Actinoplanes sp. KI2]MCU7722496.1 hypothetical protein [Actinoplanes sp. KI2]